MPSKRETIRSKIMTRATTKQLKPRPPKRARSLDEQRRRRAQHRRGQIQARQEQLRRKLKSRALAQPVSTLNEETTERLDRTQRELDGLQDDIMLTSVHDDMGQIEAVLTNLAADLQAVRTKGYAFGSYLENKVNVLTDKWEDISEQVDDEIEQQADRLEREAEEAEDLLRQALGGNRVVLSRAESAVKTLAQKANSARLSLQNRYDDVKRTIHQTRSQLNEIQWAFEQADQATFEFFEAEFLIAACRAKLLARADEDEGAEGVLFLTDERVVFEQKEKVATKKFLFVTTSSESVQEVDFEALLDWIEAVEVQDKKKFLSKKELLRLNLSAEADQNSATFRLLKGAKNEVWSQLVNRARTGQIERERIAESAAEKAEVSTQVAEAPTSCSMCGAPLPTAIARGQGEIICDYCGTVVRL